MPPRLGNLECGGLTPLCFARWICPVQTAKQSALEPAHSKASAELCEVQYFSHRFINPEHPRPAKLHERTLD
jgi:hypothetical protein